MDNLRHIAIILDGNRRYAKKLGISKFKGHEQGAKKINELIEWCYELGIEELTLYCFSTENFKRDKQEVKHLMEIFYNKLREFEKNKELCQKGIKINFIGRLEMFPKRIRNLMHELMKKTMKCNKLKINFAMAYGGRAEIVDACKKIAKFVKKNKMRINEIDEKRFSQYLYLNSEPDLLIRTSEQRISNFLLWQNAYSEIIFLPKKFWPEFTKDDLLNCINEYRKRKRRFGK